MGPSKGGVNEPVFSRVFWGPEEINNFEVPGLVEKNRLVLLDLSTC